MNTLYDFNYENNHKISDLLEILSNINIGEQLSKEAYSQKLKTYNNADNSNRWNRSLIDTFYDTNKDFLSFANIFSLNFKSHSIYDGVAIEEGQQLLFEMVEHIRG